MRDKKVAVVTAVVYGLGFLIVLIFALVIANIDTAEIENEPQVVKVSASEFKEAVDLVTDLAKLSVTPTPTPTATPTPTPEVAPVQQPEVREPEPIESAYTVTDEEREILYRIVEAEVTGEGDDAKLEAKKNVCSCILVRADKGWADGTIEGVVFEKSQFSPTSDGRYWTVKITQTTKEAVDWVLEHGATHECEYFCTTTCKSYKSGFHSKLKEAFQDGEHAYFYNERR